MSWHYISYTNMLMLVGAAMTGLGFTLLWKRRTPEAGPLALLMLATAAWAAMYALELIAPDLPTKLLGAKLKYVGIVMLPTSGLLFALRYTRREQWLRPRYLVLLAVGTLAPLLFVLTNDLHQLFWSYERLEKGGAFLPLPLTSRIGFWAFAAYSRLIILFSVGLLIVAFIRSRHIYRKQAGIVVISVIAPFVANAIYLIGMGPIPGLDLVPFGLVITCLLLTWAIFGLRLADVVRIAHATIIEATNDLVMVIDPENRVVKLNPAARDLIDRPTSEIIGKPAQEALSELIDQLDLSQPESAAEREIALGKGDARRVYEAKLSPLIDKRGIPLAKMIVLHDITARKRIEEELRASEEKYRNIFESIIDIYGEVALDGTILEISPSIKEVGGYTREELLGRSILDFHMNPESRAEVIEELLRTGKVNEWEFWLRHKEGHVLIFSFNVELATDEDGIPIKTVGIMRDITARKRMEEELRKHRDELEDIVTERTAKLKETVDQLEQEVTERKQAELQLQQREALLNSILETSLDGVAVVSENRQVVYANRALASMYGYDEASDLIGTETTDHFASESYPVLQWIRKKLDKGEPVDEVVEFTGKRKDGSTFDGELCIGLFFEGSRRFAVTAIRDVTERKRIEYQLRQSSKLAAVGQLAVGVAHEINNPLAAIEIHAGLMRDAIEDERGRSVDAFLDQLGQDIAVVEKQVERSQAVTENLLSFARIPRGETVAFDINTLLKETVKFVVSLTQGQPEIELDLDERLPAYRGDPKLLQQVFMNLLNNAMGAIEKGGRITIVTRLEANDLIAIEFRDTGRGIPESIRERIFDPFFTTKPEGEGTGLGLSISHHLIEQMDGGIRLESTPGDGSAFVVTLPVKNVAGGNSGAGSIE